MTYRSMLGWVAGVLLAGTTAAQAQITPERVFVDINFGAQGGSSDLATAGTFPLYDETATFSAAHTVDTGTLFDISGGYRVTESIAVAVGFTTTGGDSDAAVGATVPHPLFFGAPRTVTGSAAGLEHSQRAFYVQAQYRLPVRLPVLENLDVSVGAGPTFYSVSQDLVESVTIRETGTSPAFETVAIENVQVVSADESTVGFHVQADVTYMFTPNVGAGALLRYSGGSVDVSTGTGQAQSIDVGGPLFGVGLRLRF